MAQFEGVRKRVAGAVQLWRLAREKGLPFWGRLILAFTYLRQGAAGFSLIDPVAGDHWRGRGSGPPGPPEP